MNVRGIRRLARIAALGGALMAAAVPAHAQLNGENLLGDMGIKSGTQPNPGFYVSFFYYRYDTDTIKDPSGNRIRLDPTGSGSQTINAGAPILYYVSKGKVWAAISERWPFCRLPAARSKRQASVSPLT